MGAFTFLLVLVLGAFAGLIMLYSQKKYTFPGYRGTGGLGLLLATAAAGVGLVWLVARVFTGTGNIYTTTSNAVTFALKYDNTLLTMSGYLLVVGLLAMLGVAVYNTYRYGQAVM
jgi:hypothetical protein